MRVAYLLPPLRLGGWRNHACGFVKAISQYVEPVLFVAAEDYETANALFPEHLLVTLPTIQGASLRLRQLPKLASSFRAIFGRRYPQVELVHSLEAYPTGLVGHWLAARLGKPHVLTAHGTYGLFAYKRSLNRIAYRHVLRNAKALCPVSPSTADLIRHYFADAISRVYVKPILNGNDYYKRVPLQEVLARQPASVPTLLSVGAVKPRKGYHLSLQAFARLKQWVPSARYQIIGNIKKKSYYEELLRFIDSQRLSGVEFLGAVSEEQLNQCYREASVFVMAPQQLDLHFEGFGLVFLEAGAFGLPVVGTRTGGVADAIRDGETGFVVGPNDLDGLVGALRRILTDAKLARRMGIANRAWSENLTWDRYAQEQCEVYERVSASVAR